MPIKPELKSLYPPNWREISAHIRQRAGNCCENCGRPNGAWRTRRVAPNRIRVSRVWLTVAHLNHDPRDNRDENLRCLCPACHLDHDRQQHLISAAHTRHLKHIAIGQIELMEAVWTLN